MSNVVDTVENRIQNAILALVNNIITSRIESAVRSMKTSSGRDGASVVVSSGHGKQPGITASLRTYLREMELTRFRILI